MKTQYAGSNLTVVKWVKALVEASRAQYRLAEGQSKQEVLEQMA